MLKKSNYDKVLHVLYQLDIIMALLVWAFQIAPYSQYYSYWDSQSKMLVSNINVVNTIIFVILIVLTVFCVVKTGIRKPSSSFYYAIVLFAVHILIRSNMLGSYQVSDAITYFTEIEKMLYSPQNVFSNPIKNCFICGHIAHGFMFMTVLGQFLNVSSGMGFQYSNMVLGAMAAICLLYIFKKLFPKAKSFVCAIAAFIVSIQPMFLGLSTMAQMEYMLAVLFIFTLCSYVTKHYILMGFWLLVMGTCKETGTMMAFSVLFFSFLYEVVSYVKKNGGIKAAWKKMATWKKVMIAVFVAACICVFIEVLYVPVWGGTRIIDVLKIGGEGRMNFKLDKVHFLLKTRQLYILNFSWLWAIILILGLIINFAVPAVRKRKVIDGRILSFIIIQYLVYTGFLILFQEAKMTRYNILSDVLFIFLMMTIVIKVMDKMVAFVPVSAVVGALAFVEVFLTVDPVTRAVFTRIDTGGIPMVWTAARKADIEYVDINMSDFGYYNYQYTYVDRAVDKMLDAVNYQGWFRIVSPFVGGVEDQFANIQLVWDSKLRKRTYRNTEDDTEWRYHLVERVRYDTEVYTDEHTARCIFVELPFCKNDSERAIGLLKEFYIFEGPFTISEGLAGSITYYIMYLK